jgi:hypothetical protein
MCEFHDSEIHEAPSGALVARRTLLRGAGALAVGGAR